jgi:hypothetical protein
MQVTKVYVQDIANPGYGPILAVHAMGDRLYVLTQPNALFADEAAAERLADRVRAKGEIDADLWDYATHTDAEREAHLGPGGDLWQWEEMEKANGNW